jgi:hypothetical protein
LSQFLYQNRKLDLPGIGSFTLDAGTVIPQEADRIGHQPAAGITFTNANIPSPSDDLVNYIKEHTGKMKSLAAADLDFYLTTGRQLLNIGKPFHIEGIGTLLKNNDGRLNFTPGEYLIPRVEGSGPERKVSSHDEAQRDEPGNGNVRQRQTLLLIGLVAGIIIIAWGGYTFYKRNNYVEPAAENKATVLPDTPTAKKPDTTAASRATVDTMANRLAKKDTAKADATASQPTTTPPPPVIAAAYVPFVPQPKDGQSLFHFVILRTENKNHALRRYNQLLGYQLNIHMDQQDSSFFKLYFPIAATPGDTTHIKDSLADVYAARITIER